ncbi:putative tail assembly chaperone [Bacillus phage BC01]|nr:hypothetical protein PBC6_204 [Bacillus phage PBC6]AXU41319.1 putative tail assembly chaperone [Bacillus phage BC01]
MSENFNNEMPDLNKKSQEELEQEKKQEERQVIDRLIRGVNDTYIKEYDLPDYDLKFTIKIKAPNAIQMARIHAETSRYLGGTNVYQSEYILIVYQTLSTLKICGIDVPEFLKKEEELYNLELVFTIGRDFINWLDTFRR